jgi:16S rRNA (guanine966-N2)-methyltransferase
MRIIAGQWRGRTLAAPPGDGTRPTADRAREALFSILASRLGTFEGLRVLDGFAGSGALGLESLSRGAAQAVFVESDAGAARVIKANIANFDAQAEVLVMSVAALGTAAQPVDLVMLDPPYGQGLGEPALARLMAQGWLGPATLVSVETQRGEALEADGFVVLADRNYGKARLRLLQPG